jgi:hypothetical protein
MHYDTTPKESTDPDDAPTTTSNPATEASA